ncbi:WGR domain-containing protein [Chitinophaga sp. S165]|uniref:WGR domain-containing protein n=1 Tax=Chitinophaga sp. S165 TaxID=2135462 RepID=UPI000D71210B|nr:WGR domain-containing protein [Chitinophaga sp. S165]PWV46476.1 putative DNA-binding WGR domain protein [Chitinophaga sp. S165]
MKARFIYQDEKSNKFWDIETNGTDLTVQYGKVGTTGQSQTKHFASEDECKKAADKLIAEKVKKGYNKVDDTSAAPEQEDAPARPIQVTGKFAPPVELYEDLVAMAEYLEANYPNDEQEFKKVEGENIEAMEDMAGFELPSHFVDYWLDKGCFLFRKEDFSCNVYAFNAMEDYGNNLYTYLRFYQSYYGVKFELAEQEKDYFTKCCWVLGLIAAGEEVRLYVADPLEKVHIVHLPKGFEQTDDDGFAEAVASLMNARAKFSMMLGKSTDAPVTDDVEAETEPGHDDGFREISYDEALTLLGVDQLFDYWEDEDSSYASNYESEREYFDDYITIHYHDGDLNIDGDLKIQDFIIVHGNMNIQGIVSSHYYVTGDTTVDYIALSDFQKTLGKESIRYVAVASGEDDEMLHQMPSRDITAQYFFSWYYDLECFNFAPETIITAVYDYDKLSAYQTNNVFLMWHDYAFVFKPEFYYNIEKSEYAVLQISTRSFYQAVKAGQTVFLDGVTKEGVSLVKKGSALQEENDHLAAYQAYKEAISKSPGYYPAYQAAGKLLYDQKAYAQAMEIYAKAIPLTPEKVLYEFDCIEKGGIAAIQVGQYDKAIEWSQLGVEKNNNAYFPLRVIGEALIYMGELDEAKSYLEKSIEARSIFTNNWLLGLIYFLQGATKKADTYYKEAADKNANAQPYSEHKDLKYIYGQPVTVDWDNKKPVLAEKGQEYWDNFLAETLRTYGPDLYKRTGQWPSQWLFGKFGKIPVEFRTKEMLHALLDHRTKGELDVSGSLIVSFDPAFLTEEIIFHAVQREEPAQYDDIPEQFYSEKLLRIHPRGIDLALLPADQLSYEFCFEAVSQNQHNYKFVPKQFQDERMNIALIAGGCLGAYPYKNLPSKYHTNEYIKQAIDIHIQAITNIPVSLVDKEIYDHAVEKYGSDPMWPFIVECYDRNTWRFGSRSTVEELGKKVRKFGIDVFDHVDANYISKQSYSYYKKHLGHLPAFEEKVKSYDWEKNSKKTSEYDEGKEFDYDTFQKVWACFWTEEFILKALDRKSDRERIYDLPKKYLTQQICDLAVKMDSYDFEFVPEQFVTEQMCKDACSRDYGAALEYVPLAMRTEEVCDIAIVRSAENIKFVPIKFRTVERCANVIARENSRTPYIPHAQYTAVFEWSFKNRKNRFSEDYLLLHWGLGLIIDKNYSAAREKLAAVTSANAEYHQHAVYYTGWSYFLEGDLKTAKEYFTQSQDIAKAKDIDGRNKLAFPYASFQLPQVPDVYPFNKTQFDVQMKEASALVQNGFYDEALALLENMEKQLTDSQCSEMAWWAYVWDHQRYALYEAGKQEASYDLCHRIISELGSITMWDYLEDFNPIRAALRAANNNLAYRCYLTATDLARVKEGLNYIKTTMKTIAPIEDKSSLNGFYETQALLLYKATGFDPAYRKDLEKVVAKIEKLKLKEAGMLSDEYEKIKL